MTGSLLEGKLPVSLGLSASTIIGQRQDHARAEIDGELVFMNIEQGAYYGLNGMGTEIWRELAEPIEIAELSRRLSHRFTAPVAIIEADVLQFLQTLLQRELIAVHRH